MSAGTTQFYNGTENGPLLELERDFIVEIPPLFAAALLHAPSLAAD